MSKREKALPPKRVRSEGVGDVLKIFQSELSNEKEVVITFSKGFLVRKSDKDLLNLTMVVLPHEDENKMMNNPTLTLLK